MTQSECLASPSHFTHEGVCYPGSVAWIGLSSANDPKPATFSTNGATSVPERGTLPLLALALDLGVLSSRIRARGACAVLAIMSCVAGCATPLSASDQVRVTVAPSHVEGCNLLGKVIVADGPDAEKQARAEVVRLGGNMLLKKSEEVWNGNAYHCPAATH